MATDTFTRPVFAWVSNDGPCAYYRMWQPARVLADHGIQVVHDRKLPGLLSPARTSPVSAEEAEMIERTVIWGQMVSEPEVSVLWRQMAAQGRRCVYEIDDDMWSLDKDNPSSRHFTGNILRQIDDNLRVSSAVTTTTVALAKILKERTDAPVYVIPNFVPAWLLDWERPHHSLKMPNTDDYMSDAQWRQNAVTVGWAGSFNHDMDWKHLGSRFAQWANRTPEAIVHFMGHTEYLQQHASELPANRCTIEGWAKDLESYLRRICFDISIIPLKAHVFNQSKSHIKALECAALGIPVVASDYGPYSLFVEHEHTGLLFRKPGEMASALTRLVRDRDLRTALGENARKKASELTYERHWNRWQEALIQP